MRYRPLYDVSKAVSAFDEECSRNNYLRRLRLIKRLMVLVFLISLLGLGEYLFWGGCSAAFELLVIWFLNGRIAQKKRNIKEQYLTL